MAGTSRRRRRIRADRNAEGGQDEPIASLTGPAAQATTADAAEAATSAIPAEAAAPSAPNVPSPPTGSAVPGRSAGAAGPSRPPWPPRPRRVDGAAATGYPTAQSQSQSQSQSPGRIPAGPSGRHPDNGDERDDGDRGLRSLVGSGSSQVGVGAAMRARDACRPGAADLTAAEALPIIRRNWVPRD